MSKQSHGQFSQFSMLVIIPEEPNVGGKSLKDTGTNDQSTVKDLKAADGEPVEKKKFLVAAKNEDTDSNAEGAEA